jgi:hypothetical protein
MAASKTPARARTAEPVAEAPARPTTHTDTPADHVSLRRATEDDLDAVWEWTFCSELGALVRPGRGPSYRAFERWFRARLADRQTPVWTVRTNGARAGVVLLDRHDKQALPRVWMVVGLRWRSRGVGRAALGALCEQWQHPLLAEVSGSDRAAIRALEAAGFSWASEHEGRSARVILVWSP